MLRQIFCILDHVNRKKQTHTLIPLYMRMAWVFNTYLAWYLYDTTLLRRDIVTAWNCYGVTILWHYLRRLKYEHTHWYFDRWEWHNMSVWQLPGILLRRDNGTAWHKMFEVPTWQSFISNINDSHLKMKKEEKIGHKTMRLKKNVAAWQALNL